MRSHIVRRGVGIAAAVLAIVSAGVIASPAMAAGTGSSCPTNRFCFYFNSDYKGARADFARSDGSLAQELFTDGPTGRNGWGVVVTDNAASVVNNSGKRVWIYTGTRCTGDYWSVNDGVRMNLGTLRNKISSIWFEGTSSCQTVRDQSWA